MAAPIPTPTEPEKAGPDAPVAPDTNRWLTDTEIAELIAFVSTFFFALVVWPPATLLVLALGAGAYAYREHFE